MAKTQEIVGSDGSTFKSIRSLAREVFGREGAKDYIRKHLINDGFVEDSRGVSYYFLNSLPDAVDVEAEESKNTQSPTETKLSKSDYEDLKAFQNYKQVQDLPFETYTFNYTPKEHGSRYAVALFSDAHLEETVSPNGVLGLNEYNLDIAKKRVEQYFTGLARCLDEDKVTDLIFASLGDTISGFIHEELAQTNGLSPLEAVFEAQNLIYNGLRYVWDNTGLESIKFVGIVGNHARTTKKIQHNNGFKMSYEWSMYQNLKKYFEMNNDGCNIEFCMPESEVAVVVAPDGKKLMFCHGFQIKSQGTNTVCGIYPALNRLSMKWKQIFNQDKIYLGHFHSCIAIPNVVVNGSIIGYNTFALSNGFAYEEPAQMYQVFDTKIGELLTRKIYCK